jgi:hypothetical protein
MSLDMLTDEPLKPWALPFVMIGGNVPRSLVGFGRGLFWVRQQMFEVLVLDALFEIIEPRKTWAHRTLEVRDEAELMVPIPKLTKVDTREDTRLLNFGHVETHSHATGKRLGRSELRKLKPVRSSSSEEDIDVDVAAARRG